MAVASIVAQLFPCYNANVLFLTYTRFPTPTTGAGASDRFGIWKVLKVVMTLAISVMLWVLAARLEGVVSMVAATAIELAVHLAIAVGSRV